MLHFTNEESRPERLGNCPKPHSQWMEGSELEPRPWDPCLMYFLPRSTAVVPTKERQDATLGQAPQARLDTEWEGKVNCCRLLLSGSISSSAKRDDES